MNKLNELRQNLSTNKKAAQVKRPHPRNIAITQIKDSSFNHESTAAALASIVGATSKVAGDSVTSCKNSLRSKKSQRLRETIASKDRNIRHQEGLNISRIGGLGLPSMVNRSSKRQAGENGE